MKSWLVCGTGLVSLAAVGCGPLRSTNMTVSVRAADSAPARVVEVELWQEGHCLSVGNDTSIALDGERMELVSPGRVLSPRTKVLHFDLPIANCQPVLFRSRPFTGERPGGHIEVAMGRWRGSATIETLRLERRLRLASPELMVPGAEVVLEWLPGTDVWATTNASEEVRLVSEQGARVTVRDDRLTAREGRFGFVLPAMPSGPVSVSVHPGEPGPRARIDSCRGLARCTTRQVPWPAPISAAVRRH
jgi:hypothetical protein